LIKQQTLISREREADLPRPEELGAQSLLRKKNKEREGKRIVT
jgi:hypothetical protein